ncbi:MAG: hypothetical protein ABW007_02155 [Chitinophagaceae bacterium]
MKVFTKRDLKGEHPMICSFHADFVLLNMLTDGIWLIDKQHPMFEKSLDCAIDIARAYDRDGVELQRLLDIKASTNN